MKALQLLGVAGMPAIVHLHARIVGWQSFHYGVGTPVQGEHNAATSLWRSFLQQFTSCCRLPSPYSHLQPGRF